MTAATTSATETVLQAARDLAEPRAPSPGRALGRTVPRRRAAGTALLHVEAARRHAQPWRAAHRWITAAVSGQVSAADTTGLFLGAPAIGFLLSTPPAEFDRLYAQARHTVHQHVLALAHRRTDAALARIHCGDLATFAEYDIFYGLTGIGAYLLRTSPEAGALERILRYLVALTRPLRPGGRGLPGWWVRHDPQRGHSPHFPGGHANLGAAHGITGPLLLLAQTLRRGIAVHGHRDAIRTICDHLDTWRQDTDTRPVVARTPLAPRPRTRLARTDPTTPARAGATEPPASRGPGSSPASLCATPAFRRSTRTPSTGP